MGTFLVLQRTRVGSRIYTVGNAASVRAVGVPVNRVKIGLFMTVAFLGWFVGMHLLYRFNTSQAGNGVGNEFLYIVAAVVGGTLLTGGYGWPAATRSPSCPTGSSGEALIIIIGVPR